MLKEQLIDICHKLYDKGFVAATDGNVSVRLENKNFLTTRTGINKRMVAASDLVEVDAFGNIVSGDYFPSTELAMHLFIYSRRLDINAVVHAHPPYATGFAAAAQSLTGCLLPEVIVGLGAVPLAAYATPSTEEVVKSIEPFIQNSDAVLLSNHGVVAYGKDLLDAYFKMEKVEHTAHITFVARMLGGERRLTKEEVEKLKVISVEHYGKDFSDKIACATSCSEEKKSLHQSSDEEIRELVRKLLKG
jgi:L-fuculose-phosphate aldolase